MRVLESNKTIMKEIKLKVWNGNSIIGISDGGYRLIYNNSNSWRVIFGDNTDHSILASSEDGSILIQYTGLKDKNGKEIYEGDIFKCSYCKKDFGLVVWNNKMHRFQLNWSDENCGNARLTRMDNWGEVVGNIHENPELLSN